METQSNGEQPEQPTPIITVTFTDDGNMALHAERVGPAQFWAAAKLLETWGDSEFAAQMIRAQETASRIAVPGGKGGGPLGKLRRIGS